MAIIENYKNGILYYQFKAFKDIDYINHLFTSRIGWDNDNLAKNISHIFKVSKDNIIAVKQVHGANIKIIDWDLNWDANNFKKISQIEADGLITNVANIILTTYHADCVPIYFLDKTKKIVGLAHGGWRGTFENISGKMIDIFNDKYSSDKKDILVGIGPSIGPCCYEVGQDLSQKFIQRYNKFPNVVINKNNKFFLDLWKINIYQLMEKGISRDNIIVSDICTSCEVDKFYSYRKEKGTNKRMLAAIGLI